MTHSYTEPTLAILILDLAKPIESRLCLESVKRHVRVPHHVVFCDNGANEDYPMAFVREGLVDQLIVNRESRGLGLGTRDLFALTFAWWSIALQNDQAFARDLTAEEFGAMTKWMGGRDSRNKTVASISLAGAPCGDGTYSERAHLIQTSSYKGWESRIPLGYHGAGPHHNGTWREAEIQRHYESNSLTHLIWPYPLVQDNGVYAVRDMGAGGVLCHRTDSKQMWIIRAPTGPLNPAYPVVTDEESALVAAGQWPDGQIPELERAHSFRCWDNHPLAQMQDAYIADLRVRYAAKGRS